MEPSFDFRLIQHVFTEGAELGACIALVKSGHLKPYLSKAEAYRLYGRKTVEHWIEEGLITVRKDGDFTASWRIDRIEVEAIVKTFAILQFQ